METTMLIQMSPDQLSNMIRMAIREEVSKMGKGKEPDEWVDKQQAMQILGLKSEEGFSTYRTKNRLKAKLIGRKKYFLKADLIKK